MRIFANDSFQKIPPGFPKIRKQTFALKHNSKIKPIEKRVDKKICK